MAKQQIQQKNRNNWAFWLFIVLFSAFLLTNLAGSYFAKLFSGLFTALTPIILGLAIAFLLKKIINFFENRVIKNWFQKTKNPKKNKRVFSLIIVFFALIIIITALIWLIIPPLADFFKDMYNNGAVYIERIQSQLTAFFNQFTWFKSSDVQTVITNFINNLGETLANYAPIILESALTIVSRTAVFIGFFLIGMVIAFLFLKDKEKINAYAKRATYLSMSKKKADFICNTIKKSDVVLYDYFTGKIIEALLIFLLMLPGFYLLKVPYFLEMAILIAILNFIPYLGSIIAMIIIALVTFIKDTVSGALWSFLYINIILTIVGNFISPYIFGKKLKISALQVLIGLIVGGGLFGFWGMLFGPPVIAIISLIYNEWLNNKEKENKNSINKNNL